MELQLKGISTQNKRLMASMKKATAAANKKCGKIYECSFCMVACNDDIYGEYSKLYMGQPTGVVTKYYFCSENCACAAHRDEYTPQFESKIALMSIMIAELKAPYESAIRGHLKDKNIADTGIMLFNYLVATSSFLKSLVARKSAEEISLKWFKCQKYIGEMMESRHKDDEAVSNCCNEIKHLGNPMNIMAFAK